MAVLPANGKIMDEAIEELKKLLQEQEQSFHDEAWEEITEESEKQKNVSDYDRAMKGVG